MKDIYHISSEFRILIHWVPSDSLSRTFTESYRSKKHTSKWIKLDIPYAINDPPSLTPTDLMSARNWSSTIHTKITEKMRSEPAGDCDSPKKTSILLDVFFFTKKKGLAPLLRDFHIDMFSQPSKNGQVQR